MSVIDYRQEPKVSLARISELLRNAAKESPDTLIVTPDQREELLVPFIRDHNLGPLKIETKELS